MSDESDQTGKTTSQDWAALRRARSRAHRHDPEGSLPRRRRRGRIGISTVFTLTLAGLIFTYLFMSLSGRTLPAPEALRAHIEARINEQMGGARLELGSLRFSVSRGGIPEIFLSNVRLSEETGTPIAALNRLGARLSVESLFRGDFAASELFLAGAQITVRRTSSGGFALNAGTAGGEARNLAGLLEQMDQLLGTPAMAALRQVEAVGVVMTLEDARSGRIWQATNASLILRRTDTALTVSLSSDVFNGTDDVAETQFSLALNRATGRVSVGASVAGMPAGDIALQAPALSWMSVLDAPISGAVRTELDEGGNLLSIAGKLDIQNGALHPTETARPLAFDGARAYFTFDPQRQRIDFSELAVQAEEADLLVTGHAYLSELEGAWPRAFLGQFNIETVSFDGGGVFPAPVSLEGVRTDLRLRLDPFTVELAQIVAEGDDAPVRAKGRVWAARDGWRGTIDAQTDRIAPERVLAFWPVEVAPVTRRWLDSNVAAGSLEDVSFGVRFRSSEKPDLSLSFDFSDGDVRFMRQMPAITEGAGRATLLDGRFTLVLDEGGLSAGERGRVEAAGSVFEVSDTRINPAPGDIRILASGPLTAALSILNNPPLRLMERARRPVDLADAEAVVEARIALPLKGGIGPEDIDYRVTGTMFNATSADIVPGREFSSPEMSLDVTPEEIRISGPARLDGVPITADWRQSLGAEAANGSRVSGQVTISSQTVAALGLPLPDDLIGGQGTGSYAIQLAPGQPPELTLTSDLRGLNMSVPAIGWQKPAATTGAFEITARLGDTPEIEGLSLSAPGLSVDGTIALGAEGGFEGATFEDARIGDWLNGSVELVARGAGQPPGVRVTGGRVDLRQLELESGRGSFEEGPPINVDLDGLVVSDGITLAPFRGQLQRGRAGLSGSFKARVNGKTPVTGTLAPARGGTAVRLQSVDAGGVIRDAGLSPNARGGTLDLILTPVDGARGGVYDGQFLVEDIRVRNAPAIAGLLDAVSVVGLLDQLDGPGILFDEVDGQFRLTRSRLILRQAAAVGGSLGISADGIYDLAGKQMDFSGVVSPIYFLNGFGSVLTRRGEGLFGFNYRVTGTAEEPQVGVNPLSILTPGMFREIFRRRPPGE